jgi:hypothetical protein
MSVIGTLGLILAACGAGLFLRESTANAIRPIVATDPATTTEPPTTTTSTTVPVDIGNPPAVVLPDLEGKTIKRGSKGEIVKAYEQRLVDLMFDPGTVDDTFDQSTVFATQSLQKVVGLEPSGEIGNEERAALNTFAWPKPLIANGEPKRFEIDIEKQTGTLYENNRIKLITTVSTGSGQYYCFVPKSGGVRICEYADTPNGRYEFGYRHRGWQDGDLGKIYNPVYFNGGIAVHGYPQVPTRAASHGCTRIPMYIAEYFPTLVNTGDPVYVAGGRDGRRGVTATPIPTSAPVSNDQPSSTTAPAGSTTPATTPTTTPPTTAAPATTTAPPSTTTTLAHGAPA